MKVYKRGRCQRLSLSFDPEVFLSYLNYKPNASDIFIVTYPKCGTTWMIQIATLILRKGKHPDNFKDYFTARPLVEIVGPQVIKDMPTPHCLETHLPFDCVPFSSDAKYIYVARHPKDCVVSYYHHVKLFPAYYFTEGTFGDFFEAFVQGDVDFGDYFQNLLSWYENRNKPNILFLTFEEMKADLEGTIIKVARFLGEKYLLELEDDPKLLEEIKHKSSLSYMSQFINGMWKDIVLRPTEIMNDSSMPEGLRFWAKITTEAMEAGEKSVGQFLRDTTDKKMKLTQEQEKRLKEWILGKTRKSDVMSLWSEEKE